MMSAPPLGEVPDADLVRGILAGDRDAGDALARRYEPVLRTAIRKRLASTGFGPSDVENAIQQSWLKVFEDEARRLRAYDAGRPLAPFIVAVALNACRDYLKVERRKRRPPPPELAGPGEPSPEERALAEEGRAAVRRTLDRMDPDERMILEWVDQQGVSQAEAASLLDLPYRKAGTLLERARRNFRDLASRRPTP